MLKLIRSAATRLARAAWRAFSGSKSHKSPSVAQKSLEEHMIKTVVEVLVKNDTVGKKFIGDKEDRRCRICGRTQADGITFRKEAHVLPAAFGNDHLFSYEECDHCNEHVGSPLENNLADFLVLPRVMGFIPKRDGKGVKHKRKASYAAADIQSRVVNIYQVEGDPTVKLEEIGESTVKASVVANPFSRMAVCKALARMALLALPQEYFAELGHVLTWVKGEVVYQPTYCHFIIPGGVDALSFVVFRHEQPDGRPGYYVAFACGISLLLLTLPMPDWTLPGPLPIPILPAYYGEDLMDGVVGDEYASIPDVVEKGVVMSCTISHGGKRRLPADEASV